MQEGPRVKQRPLFASEMGFTWISTRQFTCKCGSIFNLGSRCMEPWRPHSRNQVWADSTQPDILRPVSAVKWQTSSFTPNWLWPHRLWALPVVSSLQTFLQTQVLGWTCSALFPPYTVHLIHFEVTLFLLLWWACCLKVDFWSSQVPELGYTFAKGRRQLLSFSALGT